MRNPTRLKNVSTRILELDWESASKQLIALRTEVFIVEQHVPPELEWDGLDASAVHLVAVDMSGRAIGCARILQAGTIGRMAVKADWRRQGIGRALLHHAIAVCTRHGWTNIALSAQTHAIPFYEKSGFIVTSEVYMDAGIPHRDMCLQHRNISLP